MDVVNLFESACTSLSLVDGVNIVFRYGTEAINNTLNEDDIEDDDFVLLLESPISKSETTNEQYGFTGTKKAKSRFILAKSSDLDNTIYNEHSRNKSTGKYSLNVVPCEAMLDLLKKKVQACNGTLTQWTYEDIYNVFDFNIDGVFVTFELTYD